MATKAATKRLGKEAQMMNKEPPPFCYARPREDNILDWQFIIRGPPDTPYVGGEYWGQLLFPPEYPFKPPGIKVYTPSGRFKPDTKICTSMSDFHPGTWNVAWSVSTILLGLLSMWSSEELTTGGIAASEADRKELAARSHAWNISQPRFAKIFPEYAAKEMKELPNMGEIKKSKEVEEAEAKAKADNKVGGEDGAANGHASSVAAGSSSAGLRERRTARVDADIADRAVTDSTAASGGGVGSAAAAAAATTPGQAAPQAQAQGSSPLLSRSKILVGLALFAYLFLSRLMATAQGATQGSQAA